MYKIDASKMARKVVHAVVGGASDAVTNRDQTTRGRAMAGRGVAVAEF